MRASARPSAPQPTRNAKCQAASSLRGAPYRPGAELFGFRHGAARWNEKTRIEPLKLPPRAVPDEPHCRWRIAMTDGRVDYAADPGEYVREHGLERDTDPEIVNHEAGKYSRKTR